jgi:hypothetical protein
MTLSELIKALEAAPDQDKVLPLGFGDPDSYRGDYRDLMLCPKADVTVSQMLADVRSALGTTYEGWKGGQFAMTGHTDCWLAYRGHGDGDTIGYLLLMLMLSAGQMDAETQDSLRKFAGTYGPGDFG